MRTGVLHFIFFHRFFPVIRPASIEVLNLTLPYVPDAELETAIDTRVYQLTRQLSSSTSPNGGVRGQIAVQFFEKRRKKPAAGLGWFGGKPDADVCWEVWRLEITLATPRTETGMACGSRARVSRADPESRAGQGHPSHGDHAAEDGHEDHEDRQSRQGPRPAHHDQRD